MFGMCLFSIFLQYRYLSETCGSTVVKIWEWVRLGTGNNKSDFKSSPSKVKTGTCPIFNFCFYEYRTESTKEIVLLSSFCRARDLCRNTKIMITIKRLSTAVNI